MRNTKLFAEKSSLVEDFYWELQRNFLGLREKVLLNFGENDRLVETVTYAFKGLLKLDSMC